MRLAQHSRVNESNAPWDSERRALLSRRISELGLTIRGSLVERLTVQLYAELDAHGVHFKPPVYLSDQWGCPDGVPLIGVPFYLADPRLARIEEEESVEVEGELDVMQYLRHEAGHAINYAYRLHDRADWPKVFGPYARPYRERYRVNPFSREHVRHILGWYAQKHPDEDFAETFAVWLTPGLDWRTEYAGWPALRKLEYVDRLMREIGDDVPEVPAPSPDDLPVESMHYTVAEHYRAYEERIPIDDERHFDGDLRTLFAAAVDAPDGERADDYLQRHRNEIVASVAYWTGEPVAIVRQFVDFLADRATVLDLRVRGLPDAALIELTAFVAAVMMNYRYTNDFDAIPDN